MRNHSARPLRRRAAERPPYLKGAVHGPGAAIHDPRSQSRATEKWHATCRSISNHHCLAHRLIKQPNVCSPHESQPSVHRPAPALGRRTIAAPAAIRRRKSTPRSVGRRLGAHAWLPMELPGLAGTRLPTITLDPRRTNPASKSMPALHPENLLTADSSSEPVVAKRIGSLARSAKSMTSPMAKGGPQKRILPT